jgi:hypothetical protein
MAKFFADGRRVDGDALKAMLVGVDLFRMFGRFSGARRLGDLNRRAACALGLLQDQTGCSLCPRDPVSQRPGWAFLVDASLLSARASAVHVASNPEPLLNIENAPLLIFIHSVCHSEMYYNTR